MPGPWSLPTDLNDGDPGQLAWGETVGEALNGATPDPTPSELVLRDAAGRMAAADPVADDDVATKGYADARGIQAYPDVAAVDAVDSSQFGYIDLEDVSTLIPSVSNLVGSTVWVRSLLANNAFAGPLPTAADTYASITQTADYQYADYYSAQYRRRRYWDGYTGVWEPWTTWTLVTDIELPLYKTGDFTIPFDEGDRTYRVVSAGAVVVTLPSDAASAVPVGAEVTVVRAGSGAVSFVAGSGVTLLNPYSTANLRAAGSTARAIKIASNTWAITGDIENASAGSIPLTTVDAKGDLIVATGPDAVTRLPIGPDDYVLTAASAEGAGMKWAVGGGGGGGGVVAPADTSNLLSGLPGRVIQNRVDTAHVSGRVYLTYFYTPVAISVNALSTDFYNITGTGGKMRVAVYEALDMATPGNLVAALGNINMAAANIDQAITPVALPAGAYFLAQHSDWEGTVTQVFTRVHKMGALGGQANNYQQGRYFYSSLASGAAWPTNLTAPTAVSADLNQNGIPEGYVMLGWSN
jgi:hypothetical protein